MTASTSTASRAAQAAPYQVSSLRRASGAEGASGWGAVANSGADGGGPDGGGGSGSKAGVIGGASYAGVAGGASYAGVAGGASYAGGGGGVSNVGVDGVSNDGNGGVSNVGIGVSSVGGEERGRWNVRCDPLLHGLGCVCRRGRFGLDLRLGLGGLGLGLGLPVRAASGRLGWQRDDGCRLLAYWRLGRSGRLGAAARPAEAWPGTGVRSTRPRPRTVGRLSHPDRDTSRRVWAVSSSSGSSPFRRPRAPSNGRITQGRAPRPTSRKHRWCGGVRHP